VRALDNPQPGKRERRLFGARREMSGALRGMQREFVVSRRDNPRTLDRFAAMQ